MTGYSFIIEKHFWVVLSLTKLQITFFLLNCPRLSTLHSCAVGGAGPLIQGVSFSLIDMDIKEDRLKLIYNFLPWIQVVSCWAVQHHVKKILPTAVPASWGCWFPGGPGFGKRFDAVWRGEKKKKQSTRVPDLFYSYTDSRVDDENFCKHKCILPIMQPMFPSAKKMEISSKREIHKVQRQQWKI